MLPPHSWLPGPELPWIIVIAVMTGFWIAAWWSSRK